MAGTRRSARVANSTSAPVYNEEILEGKIPRSGSGRKRKEQSGSSPAAKRGKKAPEEKQQSLEESLDQSKPAPSRGEDAQDAELAEVIEKSKIEVSGPNGDHEAPKIEEAPPKDTEMTDAPAAEDAKKPASAHRAPADTVPTETGPTETAPTHIATTDAAPTDAVPTDAAPKDAATTDAAPIDAATTDAAPIDAAPTDAAPTDAAPTDAAPTDAAPTDAAPTDAAPTDAAPTDTAPTEEAPAKLDHQPAQPDELSEAPVEIHGGKDQPSAENGVPEEVKATEVETKAETNGTGPSESKEKTPPNIAANGDSAVEAHAHDHDTPASIQEKGIMYFMFRGRVGIDDPQEVNDIARSFMVMRPLPHDAKLGDGPIGDAGNCRLLALPKKVLPVSGKDRFLAFVEKGKVSFRELKDVFSASDYETQTLGTRHTPAMTPVGEAVYAITTTGRESHLAYILTVPDQLREVQRDIGLKERGSFIISTKNPQAPSPANASIGKSPDYPQDIIDSFRSLRWIPSEPRHLDYANTQFLMIGESSGLDKATEAQPEDLKNEKDTPLQEMEKLEGEDEIRVRHLKGDDAIFVDLGMSKSELPSIQSTW